MPSQAEHDDISKFNSHAITESVILRQPRPKGLFFKRIIDFGLWTKDSGLKDFKINFYKTPITKYFISVNNNVT